MTMAARARDGFSLDGANNVQGAGGPGVYYPRRGPTMGTRKIIYYALERVSLRWHNATNAHISLGGPMLGLFPKSAEPSMRE